MSENKDITSTPIEETPTENTEKQEEVKEETSTLTEETEKQGEAGESTATIEEVEKQVEVEETVTPIAEEAENQEVEKEATVAPIELVPDKPTEEIGLVQQDEGNVAPDVESVSEGGEGSAIAIEGLEKPKESLSKQKNKKNLFIIIAIVVFLAIVAVITSTSGSKDDKSTKTKTTATTKAKTSTKVQAPQPRKVAPVLVEKKLTKEQKVIESESHSMFDASVKAEQQGDATAFLKTMAKQTATDGMKKNLEDMYKRFQLKVEIMSVKPVKLTKDTAILRIEKKISATKKNQDDKINFTPNISIADITFIKEDGKWKQLKKDNIDVKLLDDKGNVAHELKFSDKNQPIVVTDIKTDSKTATKK